jgi:AcrR family transcriptional regulator
MYQVSGRTLTYDVPSFNGTVYGVCVSETTDRPSAGAYPVSEGTPEGRRMIELLWDPPGPGRRGPRQKISLERVVDGALALADADGFEALSMRGLAKHLGVGAMSLYTYVPGKAELFELMIDRAYRGRVLPAAELDWRQRYEAHARAALDMYRRHPWLVHSNLWRLPMGPHVLDVEEDMLRVGADAGLDADLRVRMASLLESYIFGIARGEIADRSEVLRTGMSRDDYWEARSSFWGTYFDQTRYPTTRATWERGGFQGDVGADDDLAFALGLILDSVQRLITSAR